MPRFAFGKRKSTAEGENDTATPSFRVLERSEVSDGNNKSFDGAARFSAKPNALAKTTVSDVSYEDNIFADFKPTTNRYVRELLHSSHLLNNEAVAPGILSISPQGVPNLSYPGNSCLRADLMAHER